MKASTTINLGHGSGGLLSRKLLDDIKRIKNSRSESIIRIPGFDHEKGDPEPDQHEFNRDKHKVVIVEGLYLLHDGDAWKEPGAFSL